MRKYLASVAAAAVVTAAVPANASGAAIHDIASHWAKAQVESGVEAGYIAGYPDGSFKPDRSITRAEFFKLLTVAMRAGDRRGTPGFTDTDHWAFEQGHVQAAVGAGLISPPDYGTQFAPDTQITRREIVLAAVRALGKEALVNGTDPLLNAADASSYETWLKGWAAVAIGEGIIGGYPDGSLGLNRTATRAEALVMVQRILEKVTMELTEFETAHRPGMVRHPGEGEPYWSFAGEVTLRPTVTNGKERYTFPEDARNITLMPAPGNALWVSYVTGGASGVVGRLAGGRLTEMARLENAQARLLDVDDQGRLWYSAGQEKLVVVDSRGQATAFDGVKAELGELDAQGNLWAFGILGPQSWTLTKVSPAGTVSRYDVGSNVWESVSHMAAAEDGSVWLIVSAGRPEAGFLEARQYLDGKELRRQRLVNPHMVSGVWAGARVAGRSGPYLWVTTHEQDGPNSSAMTGLYKFDLTTGAFVPQVEPRTVGAGFAVLPAPGSGALIKDTAGAFWRILP